eukprot:TRINITY_DN2614_c0_g2_i1.p1 TRINITY_DN2614_c0_g2~~TRINITY_DN2614_c0_g2_i1.p1  ORF type:complete len:383 (+),score=147.41 TRINITY_DN2614_c0_g2_i1:191-1339(+)
MQTHLRNAASAVVSDITGNGKSRPKTMGRTSSKVFIIIGFSLLWTLLLARRAFSVHGPAEEDFPKLHDEGGHHLARAEDPSNEFLAEPHHRDIVSWHGQHYEEGGEWDFFGLKVPNSPAISRARSGQISSDYDLTQVNSSHVPKGYSPPAHGDPALIYPDRNDRLFVTASTMPRALFFPNIVTDEEVDEIIRQASPRITRSQVAITKEGAKRNMSSTQDVRTSSSTWVNLDDKLSNLNKRLCAIVGTTWHEPMNVLRYGRSQHYDSHHDYFDPNFYGTQHNNRMATFYLYLSDTESGGATTIPRANGGRPPANFQKAACQQGLQVYPRKGSGVLFYNMRPDRTLDPLSLHGACDVEQGIKWGGPVWFRANTPSGTGNSRNDI